MKNIQTLTVILGLLFTASVFGEGVTLPDAERIVLDNGTVLIINEKHDVPLIGLQAIVRGGASSDPEGKHGLASLLANLMEKGSGERNAVEFAEAVAGVGGELNASTSLEAISISASFMADDAALMVHQGRQGLRPRPVDVGVCERVFVRRTPLWQSRRW